jgi:hypothetical protein
MPMLGVMRLTLDDDCESISGDDDFFSVARTMPLVAGSVVNHRCCSPLRRRRTLDTQRRDTLVDSVQSILYSVVSPSLLALHSSFGTHLFEPAFHCSS